jgi:hypothetical protein
MAKTHKAQHWIPKSYLRAWTDPDTPGGQNPFVYVFARDGSEHRKRAPSNIFTETDLYTIKLPDGRRDLRLEHGLSQLEDSFAIIRKDFLARRRQLPWPRWLRLMAFLAAMHARTPAIRDHHMTFWGQVQDQMEKLERHMQKATPEERMRAASSAGPSRSQRASMTLEDVRRLTSSPMEHTLTTYIAAELPYLVQMGCTVLCTSSNPGFITSDCPVVWFDPEWHKKPPIFRSPRLSDPLLEISLPISPSQMLILFHRHPALSKTITFIDVEEHHVDEFNRRTRFCCDKEFVVRKDITHARWFEKGTMPPDAWELTHDKAQES